MLKLKALKDWAFKKLGVSTTGRVHEFKVKGDKWDKYRTGKRTIFIAPARSTFELGDILRLRKIIINDKSATGFELHFFIKDILVDEKGIMPGYCVLTLE